MTSPSRGGYYVIVGGVLLHLTLGTLYLFGSIQPYVASYLRLHDPSITVEDTSLIYSVTTLVLSICMPLVGILQFRFGLRGCAAFGASLVGCSTLICSAVTTIGGTTVMNAIFGAGVAYAYTCPLVSGYAWMPDRKGLVSGFVVAGFGSGAAVFNVLATWLVNPENASPDPKTGFFSEEIARRVPMMYMILGMIYLLMGVVGSTLLSPPPPASSGIVGKYESLADVSTSIKEVGKSVEEEIGVANKNDDRQQRQYECLELLKELDFYTLSVTMVLTTVSGLFIAGNYKRIAMQSFSDADRFLSVLGCVASLCNGAGRIIFGLALDRFGGFATLVVLSVSSTVLLMALGLIPATRYLFFLAICLLLFMYGGNFAVYPALTANMFGITSAGPNYGLVFLFYGVTCFIIMLWLAELAISNEIFLYCGVISCVGNLSVASLWTWRYRRQLPM